MRILFLAALFLVASCGKKLQTKEEKLQYQRQNFLSSNITCLDIRTDITKERITCPSSLITQEKQFLFSIDKEKIDLNDLNLKRKAYVTIMLHAKTPIQGMFYLVSKYGKRLSEDVFFDGINALTFKELRVGDFSAHDVFLKLTSYHTGGVPVSVENPIDKGCDTGLFNLEDVNLEDLRGQCSNLKFIPNIKVKVEAPVYKEGVKKFSNMRRVNVRKYDITSRFRIFDHMNEREISLEKLYSIEKTEFGFEIDQKTDNLCFREGFYDHQLYEEVRLDVPPRPVYVPKKRSVSDNEARTLCKNCQMNVDGDTYYFKEIVNKKICYAVKPILTGRVLIKE